MELNFGVAIRNEIAQDHQSNWFDRRLEGGVCVCVCTAESRLLGDEKTLSLFLDEDNGDLIIVGVGET